MNVLNIMEHITGSMLNLNKPIHIFHWQKHFYLTFPGQMLCNMLNFKNQTTSKYVECLPTPKIILRIVGSAETHRNN